MSLYEEEELERWLAPNGHQKQFDSLFAPMRVENENMKNVIKRWAKRIMRLADVIYTKSDESKNLKNVLWQMPF